MRSVLPRWRHTGVWVGALLVLALAGTSNAAAPASDAAEPATSEAANPASAAALIEQMRVRSRELDRRDGEVAARERSLADLEKKVEARIAELEGLQKTIDERLAGFSKENGDRIAQLAKVYGKLPAKKAAPLIERLEIDLAVQVVSRMKDKENAALFAAMSPDYAVRLSRLVARPLATASHTTPHVAAPGRPGGTP